MMRPPPSPGPSEEQLFDDATRLAAGEQDEASRFRWLALSDDPEAMNLRRTLSSCWALAGDSRDVLRKGLMHERWGQHAGALAHLLALGLFAREGYDVECEPDLGRQSPDLLVSRNLDRMLVEVRSITGCGDTPWDHTEPAPAPAHPIVPPRRRGRRARSPAQLEREARARARKRAAQRAATRAAETGDLREVVVRVLEKKAAAYKELCGREELPYVICIYQDTDTQISPLVRDWAFGQGDREQDAEGGWHSTHDPADGVFFGDRWHTAHVSGVLVFGRVDDALGRLFMRGDLIVNPYAERPLADGSPLPHLRTYRLRTNVSPPRMRWAPHVAPPFEIVPHP
jgi:hypothetical protein